MSATETARLIIMFLIANTFASYVLQRRRWSEFICYLEKLALYVAGTMLCGVIYGLFIKKLHGHTDDPFMYLVILGAWMVSVAVVID